MAILDIKKYPQAILRQQARQIEVITPQVERLAEDMVRTMYLASGVGLAGPQVGERKRIFVVDPKPENKKPMIFINPEIIRKEGKIVSEEACLSLPGLRAKMRRSERVILRALDIRGQPVELEAEGLFARIVQHEFDHLNGILFIDHLGFFKRHSLLKRYRGS